MLIERVNDAPTHIEMFDRAGTPTAAYPSSHYGVDANESTRDKIFSYFGLGDSYYSKLSFINDLRFKYETEFKFGYITQMQKVKYLKTIAVIDGELTNVLLHDAASRATLEEDFFSNPMIHIFESKERKYELYYTVVNLPDDVLTKQEESLDGAST